MCRSREAILSMADFLKVLEEVEEGFPAGIDILDEADELDVINVSFH